MIMKVIVCLEKKLGILFNHRRLSKDRKVVEDICKRTKRLYMSPFSEPLFCDAPIEICVDVQFLEKAHAGDVCFVENQLLESYVDKIEELVVYQWNRSYPSDTKFDIPLQEWKKISEEDFVGFSHEKITRQVYVRG